MKNLSVFLQRRRSEGVPYPQLEGIRSAGAVTHPGVTREARNGLTESVRTVYDEVKNPGNTRRWEWGDNSHLLQ